MPDAQPVTLADAATRYLASQATHKVLALQPEVQKFVRWYGREKVASSLTPRQIEAYCEATRAEDPTRLAPLKGFLQFLHTQELTQDNLASHAKARRRAPAVKVAKTAVAAPVAQQLTPEGHRQAQAELEELKEQRVHVAEEIRRAAADKDFRENAPLDAAREKQAHLEARIRELEQILRYAEVVQNGPVPTETGAVRVRIGTRVVVADLTSNEQLTYMLVAPREMDPRQGKISVESPTGRAFLERMVGEVVMVQAPAGMLRYRIDRIEA